MAVATINARHRKHYKSGACLESAPIPERARYTYRKSGNESSTKMTSVLCRPEYFERQRNPRTTQSMFGRAMSKVLGLFKKGRAA